LDEPRADRQQALALGFEVGDVDVEMDRQLDRRRLLPSVEEELRPITAPEVGLSALDGVVAVEQLAPERRHTLRLLAGEGDVVQAQHAGILISRTCQVATGFSRSRPRAPPPIGWG